MRWTPLYVAGVSATLCVTALTSLSVCIASPHSSRSGSHNKHKSPASKHPATRVSPVSNPVESSSAQNGRDISAGEKQIDRSAPFDREAGHGALLALPSRGENIARTALAYRGVPYRFGGRSAQSGFDCSGLVQAVCAKWGIYLPRVASDQFAKGAAVKPHQLQPGDLVFFRNTYKRGLSHVGIYVGAGQFIHAAGRGQGVTLSFLGDSYHKRHYAGARRLDLKHLPPAPDQPAIDIKQVTVEKPDAVSAEKPVEVPAPPATPIGRTARTGANGAPSDESLAGEGAGHSR